MTVPEIPPSIPGPAAPQEPAPRRWFRAATTWFRVAAPDREDDHASGTLAGKGPGRRGNRAGRAALLATADELWARVRAAEKDAQAALDQYEAFGVLDPTSEGSAEYEEAHRSAGRAWVRAEQARHELDAFLNPARYAKKGYRAEALQKFRVRAAAAEPGKRPHRMNIKPGGAGAGPRLAPEADTLAAPKAAPGHARPLTQAELTDNLTRDTDKFFEETPTATWNSTLQPTANRSPDNPGRTLAGTARGHRSGPETNQLHTGRERIVPWPR